MNYRINQRIEVTETKCEGVIKAGERGTVVDVKPNPQGFGTDLAILFDRDEHPMTLNAESWAGSLRESV